MLLAILFCILKNNASGYPATVTAIDIIDTKDVHRHKIIGGTGNTAQILHGPEPGLRLDQGKGGGGNSTDGDANPTSQSIAIRLSPLT